MEQNREHRGASSPFGLLAVYAMLLGLLAFAHWWHAPADPWQVVVTRAQIDARVQAAADLRGAPLGAAERRAVVSDLAEEAVLLREAARRRLDRGDPLVRGPLLGGIVTELAGPVPEPTDPEIRAWYEEHAYRYAQPETLTLEQAVFDASAAPEDPERVLARLNGGETPSAVGTVPGVPSRSLGQSRLDLLLYYGSGFAETVLEIPDEVWHGPLESTMGIHYVKVTARRPSTPQSFEEVRSYVREDVERARLRDAVARPLDDLRRRYGVRIEGVIR